MNGSNLLTTSRLSTYQECRRKHHLMYIEGWRPRKAKDSLRFGSLLHDALAAWWLAKPTDRLGPALNAIRTAKESDPLDAIKAEELMIGYHEKWESDRTYRVISIEKQFRVPLVNPETGGVSRTWLLAGKRDGLLSARARTVVMEHKTTSEDIKPDSTYWRKLDMDNQISSYVLAAEAEGIQVEDTLYDVIKKVNLRPHKATPEEKRQYTRQGRLYANQREFDETEEEFRVRVRESISSDPDAYFQRKLVPRMDSQLRDFMFDAWEIGRAIADDERLHRAPRNPNACFRYGSENVCPFWDHCANGLDLSTSPDFVRLDNVHPELEEEEEDAKQTVA